MAGAQLLDQNISTNVHVLIYKKKKAHWVLVLLPAPSIYNAEFLSIIGYIYIRINKPFTLKSGNKKKIICDKAKVL